MHKNQNKRRERDIEVDISEDSDLWQKLSFNAADQATQAIVASFDDADIPLAIEDFELIVSLVLGDDEMVKKLNLDYRKKDSSTNVLSFSSLDTGENPVQGVPYYLGEIVLSYTTLKNECETQDKEMSDHFSHLVVHGTLHLLGYDHENDKDAEIMENLEIVILKKMGLKNPYL